MSVHRIFMHWVPFADSVRAFYETLRARGKKSL